MNTESSLHTGRYQLLEALGTGAMGSVLRAYDRLSNQFVALKQVLVAPAQLAFASRPSNNDHEELLLALTHEFRTLAGLRHPHIISVLDYGFDTERRPFFTMELLTDAHTILDAGVELSLEEKIGLLIQMLEALAYLHRRDILHHDLKPANVLVAQGQLRLLDFGLAVVSSQERSDDSFGTLQYLAPEILDAQPYTIAADLFSVGVITYELLLGKHPFLAPTLDESFHNLFYVDPDLSLLNEQPEIATLLRGLLAKDAADRPPSAQAVIVSLCQILGMPRISETTAIRESYLQAAAFVGRDQELAQLTQALERAQRGQGSSWLIGGESGVGKSRLLEELRVQALVQGFHVVAGQAIEGGGLPYQLWREPVRRLVLQTPMSDLEAAILQELVPDMTSLLGRNVGTIAPLTGEAGRQRLIGTLIDIFRSQSTPLLIILKDLHWSSESLVVLNELNRYVADLPLLVLGSYRDDERSGLATELPGMQQLKLDRLQEAAIAELSASMLGEHGRTPEVLTLLKRETEGNTFFMVEVVRVLAEEAGGLTQIGQTMLPTDLFAGGVQQVLRRRLARIPQSLWGLLKLAAVAGRELDPTLLACFAPDDELAKLQSIGADTAIFEVSESRWRFAHDKLREVLLADLQANERPALHRQVAEALEAVYPGQNDLAETLMEHWRGAGEPARELAAMLQLVISWIDYGLNYYGACALLERGSMLAQHTADPQQQLIHIYHWTGKAYERLSDFPKADLAYEQSRTLAEELGDIAGLAAALRGTGRTLWRQGHLLPAIERCAQALQLHQQLHNQKGIADCMADLGIMHVEQHHFDRGEHYLQQALVIFRSLNDMDGVFGCLNDLGLSASSQGNNIGARAYLHQALALARQVNHRDGIALSLLNIGIEYFEDGKLVEAYDSLIESLTISREVHDHAIIAINLQVLGLIAMEEQNYALAQSQLQQALDIYHATNLFKQKAIALRDLGLLAMYQGDTATALAYYEQCLPIFREFHDYEIISALVARAWLQLDNHNRDAAAGDIVMALNLAKEHQVVPASALALLGWARLLLLDGNTIEAAAIVGLVESQPEFTGIVRRRFLNPILAKLEAQLTLEQLRQARQCGAGRDLQQVLASL